MAGSLTQLQTKAQEISTGLSNLALTVQGIKDNQITEQQVSDALDPIITQVNDLNTLAGSKPALGESKIEPTTPGKK